LQELKKVIVPKTQNQFSNLFTHASLEEKALERVLQNSESFEFETEGPREENGANEVAEDQNEEILYVKNHQREVKKKKKKTLRVSIKQALMSLVLLKMVNGLSGNESQWKILLFFPEKSKIKIDANRRNTENVAIEVKCRAPQYPVQYSLLLWKIVCEDDCERIMFWVIQFVSNKFSFMTIKHILSKTICKGRNVS